MSDRYDQDRLLRYIEADMSAEQRQQFEQELADDPAMRRLLEQLCEDRLHLRAAADQPAPAGLMERAHAHLERQMLMGGLPAEVQELRGRRRAHAARWAALGGLAAMLLLSAGMIVFMLMDTSSLNDAAEQTALAQRAVPPALEAMTRSSGGDDVAAGGRREARPSSNLTTSALAKVNAARAADVHEQLDERRGETDAAVDAGEDPQQPSSADAVVWQQPSRPSSSTAAASSRGAATPASEVMTLREVHGLLPMSERKNLTTGASGDTTEASVASAMREGHLPLSPILDDGAGLALADADDVDVTVRVPAAGTAEVRALLAAWVRERGGEVRIDDERVQSDEASADRPMIVQIPSVEWSALLALLKGSTVPGGFDAPASTGADALVRVQWRQSRRGAMLVMREALAAIGMTAPVERAAPLSTAIYFDPPDTSVSTTPPTTQPAGRVPASEP